MLVERGVVCKVDTQSITVNCRSKIDCLRCAQGKGCGGGILARWLGDRQYSVKAFYDSANQSPKLGEFVSIAIPANRIVKLAAIMYGIPLLLMLLLLAIQTAFFSELLELMVIALAVMALLVGFKVSSVLVEKANASGLMLPSLMDQNCVIETDVSDCKNKAPVS